MAVFAIDFGAPGGEDSFGPFAARHSELSVVRLTPPGMGDSPPEELSVDAYAGRYAAQITATGAAPAALLAYCAGGTYALEVAARLGRDDCPVVLVDSLPSGGDLRFEFERTVRDLGWAPDSPNGVDLPAEVAAADEIHRSGDTAGAVTRMTAVADRFAGAFLAGRGVPEQAVSGLVRMLHRRCESWFRWVAASRVGTPSVGGPGAVVVCASRSMAPSVSAAWAGWPVEVRRLDVARDDVLASDDLDTAVLAVLGVYGSV